MVFKAGEIELALHLAGEKYRNAPTSFVLENQATSAGPTTKLVFAITSDLAVHRELLHASGTSVGPLKRYDGFPYEMYDGRDPEGNIFQVMRFD